MSLSCRCKSKKTKGRRDPLWLILMALFIVSLIVFIGTIGFRIFGQNEWIDAFQNAALVFTATTLVAPVDSYEGKVFSSIYNLISGIFVLVIIVIIFTGAIREEDLIGKEKEEESEKCECCNYHDSSDDETENSSSSDVFDYYSE